MQHTRSVLKFDTVHYKLLSSFINNLKRLSNASMGWKFSQLLPLMGFKQVPQPNALLSHMQYDEL